MEFPTLPPARDREPISPSALYALLFQELELSRPVGCADCRMPLPFPIEPPDEVSANWRIGTPAPCGFGCDAVIAEIMAGLWPQYDLGPMSSR